MNEQPFGCGSNPATKLKKEKGRIKSFPFLPVPGAGFEPARVSPYAPQTYVYANSTTRANPHFQESTGFPYFQFFK